MNRQEFAVAFFGSAAVLLTFGLAVAYFANLFHLSAAYSAGLGGFFVVELVLWKYISIVGLVKRFHDMDRSGMWWLLLFIPFVGFIVYLFAFFGTGTAGSNKYGSPTNFFEARALPTASFA